MSAEPGKADVAPRRPSVWLLAEALHEALYRQGCSFPLPLSELNEFGFRWIRWAAMFGRRWLPQVEKALNEIHKAEELPAVKLGFEPARGCRPARFTAEAA